MSIVVREALMEPIRNAQDATHFKRVPGPNYPADPESFMLEPCPPSDPHGKRLSVSWCVGAWVKISVFCWRMILQLLVLNAYVFTLFVGSAGLFVSQLPLLFLFLFLFNYFYTCTFVVRH